MEPTIVHRYVAICTLAFVAAGSTGCFRLLGAAADIGRLGESARDDLAYREWRLQRNLPRTTGAENVGASLIAGGLLTHVICVEAAEPDGEVEPYGVAMLGIGGLVLWFGSMFDADATDFRRRRTYHSTNFILAPNGGAVAYRF